MLDSVAVPVPHRSTEPVRTRFISTQAIATNDVAIGDVARTALEELEKGIKEASDFEDELFEEFDRMNQPPESAYAWID